MKKLSSSQIKNTVKLNTKLAKIEKKIFKLALNQYKMAQEKLLDKEDDITDFELQVDISMYVDEGKIVNWTEHLKSSFSHKRAHPINDGENHNVTSCCWENEALNSQQHCWLLHSLYDDKSVAWNEILKINLVWFDVNIKYQYSNII